MVCLRLSPYLYCRRRGEFAGYYIENTLYDRNKARVHLEVDDRVQVKSRIEASSGDGLQIDSRYGRLANQSSQVQMKPCADKVAICQFNIQSHVTWFVDMTNN